MSINQKNLTKDQIINAIKKTQQINTIHIKYSHKIDRWILEKSDSKTFPIKKYRKASSPARSSESKVRKKEISGRSRHVKMSVKGNKRMKDRKVLGMETFQYKKQAIEKAKELMERQNYQIVIHSKDGEIIKTTRTGDIEVL